MWRALALAGVVSTPPTDHAQDVAWSAPVGCPDRESVIRKIVELSPDVGAGELVAAATVADVEGGKRLHASIETRSGVTKRTVDSEDCAALADAFAVFVAVAAAPDLPPPRPPSTEQMQPKPPPARPPPQPPAPEPARRGVARPGGVFQIAPFVELGLAPGVSGGPLVTGGLAWPSLRVMFGGSYTAPRLVRHGGPRSGIAVHLATAHAQVCPARTWRRGDAWVCGRLEAGAVIGRGRGVRDPRTVTGAWAAGGVAPGGSLRLKGPLRLFAEFAGVVPITRAAFELDGSTGLYRAGAVVARFMLGLELRFEAKKTTKPPTTSPPAAQ